MNKILLFRQFVLDLIFNISQFSFNYLLKHFNRVQCKARCKSKLKLILTLILIRSLYANQLLWFEHYLLHFMLCSQCLRQLHYLLNFVQTFCVGFLAWIVEQIFSRHFIHMAGRRKLVQTKRLAYANGILISQPLPCLPSLLEWSQRPSVWYGQQYYWLKYLLDKRMGSIISFRMQIFDDMQKCRFKFQSTIIRYAWTKHSWHGQT